MERLVIMETPKQILQRIACAELLIERYSGRVSEEDILQILEEKTPGTIFSYRMYKWDNVIVTVRKNKIYAVKDGVLAEANPIVNISEPYKDFYNMLVRYYPKVVRRVRLIEPYDITHFRSIESLELKINRDDLERSFPKLGVFKKLRYVVVPYRRYKESLDYIPKNVKVKIAKKI